MQALRRIAMFSSEAAITQKIQTQLQATKVLVKDIGGGCGTMYDILVESPLFKGKTRVQQH
jgi:stress-induced morphogen